MAQGKVLIVDDDSSLLKALVRILELQGFEPYQPLALENRHTLH